jgi:hypothetical protein
MLQLFLHEREALCSRTHDEELIRLGLQHTGLAPNGAGLLAASGHHRRQTCSRCRGRPAMPRLIWAEIVGPPAKSWHWSVPEIRLCDIGESVHTPCPNT